MILGHDFTASVVAWAIFSPLYFWLPDLLVMIIFMLDHVNFTIIYCYSYYFSHVYIYFWPYDFGQGFSFVSQAILSLFIYFFLVTLFLVPMVSQ